MTQDNAVALKKEDCEDSRSLLDELAREGARRMLQKALENEVGEYLETHEAQRDASGRRLVTRNGYLPARALVSGVGPLEIRQPRVRDERPGQRFTSAILPPFLRRLPSVEAVIPILYLKGISTGDFSQALASLLGERAKGLSPTNIVRLKRHWEAEYEEFSRRDLSGKHYVYFWADGVHFNVRLEDERTCILVLMGATKEGKKEIVAVSDGFRESKQSWLELLRGIKARGLTIAPKLAVGDGALGFWAALAEEYPATQAQRCWVHKTANVLDKMPKSVRGKAKAQLHEMCSAPTRETALKAYAVFGALWSAKYPKAWACLERDKESMFVFYDFPAEHWRHLRTTNPIESTFATVRLRTARTKGCGSRTATLTMVFKLALEAEKRWRRLNGYQRLAQVIDGVRFVDGEMKKAA